MSDTFVITGIVREKESKIGLPGLIVRAYDKDLLYDDLMGEDRTSCDGSFRIVSDAEDFRDFFDKRPDIYLRILVPGHAGGEPREVFNTAHSVRWNAGHLEYMVVEIPHSIACDLPCGDDEHSHGGGHTHEHGNGLSNLCFRPIAAKILPAPRVLFGKEGKR